MVSGPVRKKRYSRPIEILPESVFAHSFKVRTFLTLKPMRSCRWSCRFSPTPGDSCATGMPCCESSAPGPMPESCRICGEPIAPAARMVSMRAPAKDSSFPRKNSTPAALRPSMRSRRTCACVITVRFGRRIAGRRNAFDAFQRTPRFWFTSNRPEPSLSPRLKSGIFGMPASAIASEGIEDFPGETLALDAPFSARAVHRVRAEIVVFGALEHGQHVVPAPAGVAERFPLVVVAGLPAHIHHGVDRGAAAQHFSARIENGAAVQPGLGLGAVAPVGARIADAVEIADRDVDPDPVVLAACFEQQHAHFGIGGQAVGEQTTRRSCTDDHVVPGPGSFRHSALLCLPENPMSSTEKLKLGLKGTADLVVREEHTAPLVGIGRVHVLATPVMINVIEAAALAAIEHLLPE